VDERPAKNDEMVSGRRR